MKINKSNINSQVDGIKVASMKYDGISKKLVTWRDTITSQSENVLICDRICEGIVRETQSVSGVSLENHKKNASDVIECSKKNYVKDRKTISKNVSLNKKLSWNQAKTNNKDQINKLDDVKLSRLQMNFEESSKQKCFSKSSENFDKLSSDISSLPLDLKFIDGKDSELSECKSANERQENDILEKIATKKSNNKKVVEGETTDSHKQKDVTPLLDFDENLLNMDYNWNKGLVETEEKQFIDVDVQEEFSFQKFVRKKYCSKPSTPISTHSNTTSIEIKSQSPLSSTIHEDLSFSVSSLTTSPLKCSKTKFNLDEKMSQESLINTTVQTSSDKDDSLVANDLRSLPKFDWSTGELPTFTKSISCLKEELNNNLKTELRINNKLIHLDDVKNKIESNNTFFQSNSTLKEEDGAQEDMSIVKDSIVLLYKSESGNKNEMSHNQIVFNNYDSDSIELEISKSSSSNHFLKKSLSDIDILKFSNSKNNLISLFSRHFKEYDDIESLNSKKNAVSSLPNIILHYDDEFLTNKIENGEKIKYALNNLDKNDVIDNDNDETEQILDQKPTISKEMLRRKILEIGAKEFLQDFPLHDGENFRVVVAVDDYSVPKKKRKLEECISSSKSQSLDRDFHINNKVCKRKKRFKRNTKKENKETFGDISTQSEEAGDGKVPVIMLPHLLPFRSSRRTERPLKSTKKDCQIKSPSIFY